MQPDACSSPSKPFRPQREITRSMRSKIRGDDNSSLAAEFRAVALTAVSYLKIRELLSAAERTPRSRRVSAGEPGAAYCRGSGFGGRHPSSARAGLPPRVRTGRR